MDSPVPFLIYFLVPWLAIGVAIGVFSSWCSPDKGYGSCPECLCEFCTSGRCARCDFKEKQRNDTAL